jgi:hypothetical protein
VAAMTDVLRTSNAWIEASGILEFIAAVCLVEGLFRGALTYSKKVFIDPIDTLRYGRNSDCPFHFPQPSCQA